MSIGKSIEVSDDLNEQKLERARTSRLKWYYANREKVLEKMAADYAAMRPDEKALLFSRRDKAKASQCNASRYEKNPEAFKGKIAEYRAKNPEKKRIWDQNRRARKLQSGGKLSADLVARLLVLQKSRCACCKISLKKTGHHLDHIEPLSRGGANVDLNMQLLCPTCNCKKHSKPPIEFMQSIGFLI